MTTRKKLIEKVAEIYNWIDAQIYANYHTAEKCKRCGKCCDFDNFDHRLFITTPELVYLSEKSGDENKKTMPKGRCPYNIEDKCSIYKYRFAGCRIFLCKADKDLQNQLSEAALNKLKSICKELETPYRYTDLATALNNFSC